MRHCMRRSSGRRNRGLAPGAVLTGAAGCPCGGVSGERTAPAPGIARKTETVFTRIVVAYNGARRQFLGSTADKVSRYARCTIMIVP